MSVKKLSVALEGDVAALGARSAERMGMSFSAWLNRAAKHALTLERGAAAVRAWERDHGSLTDRELAAADALLDAPAPRRR